MTEKQRAAQCVEILKKVYPDARCSLDSKSAFELLVATRLSAQCTDARVNMVTPALFKRFPTPEEMSKGSYEEVGEYIKSCGLYKTKAKSLVEMSKMICEKFDGEVPATLEDLITLPGIGRKTANLIMGDIYGKPAVVADTHLIRISNRLGFCDTSDPVKVEMKLKGILDPEESNDFCHRIVHFGRDTCSARNPKCNCCPLSELCRNHVK